MKKIFGRTLWLAGLLCAFSNAWMVRRVTDQLGRTLPLSCHVTRVVVLQVRRTREHRRYSLKQEKQRGEHDSRLAPRLVDLPMS